MCSEFYSVLFATHEILYKWPLVVESQIIYNCKFYVSSVEGIVKKFYIYYEYSHALFTIIGKACDREVEFSTILSLI